MNPAPITRFLPKRPIYRCLNFPRTPVRTPQRCRYNSTRDALTKDYNGSNADAFMKDPLRREEIERRKLIQGRNRAALGAALCMLLPIVIIQFYDLDDLSNKKKESKSTSSSNSSWFPSDRADAPASATRDFQGKPVVVTDSNEELVPTGTSYVPFFPRSIQLPTTSGSETAPSSEEYTLLGLGIRKVSFLRVQVYVVGLYVKNSSLPLLQSALIKHVNPAASALIPGEKDHLRRVLLDGESSERVWDDVLQRRGLDGIEMALRVVPTRGTDFKHLQDGWMRGLTNRTQDTQRRQQQLLAQQQQEQAKKINLPKPVDPSEFADESFGESMRAFRSLFAGRGKAAKGSVIIFTRDAEGVFRALYQSQPQDQNVRKGKKDGEFVHLGEVKDERVSRLVWELYLGGKNVSSEEARKSVVEGCINLVERPVGSVEGMVGGL
ncbi:hypothetical protein BU16DRAFT_498718 [Lophium mytilinum]|uniref:Chalcone isomerase domain-containing protein n=1 Tax=Lophium mytilinum TaxID=390894 RepID=A0A6A6RDV1_9PEZI|nr:hypothetical protein BU16DRAFT_498718 [Lophium mytilinum]